MESEKDSLNSFHGSLTHDSKFSASEESPLLRSPKNKRLNIEEALDEVGVGFFHFILILVTGWALASDSVEVLCISFVSPQLTSNATNPDTALVPSSVS